MSTNDATFADALRYYEGVLERRLVKLRAKHRAGPMPVDRTPVEGEGRGIVSL